jgi:hypothetical protein
VPQPTTTTRAGHRTQLNPDCTRIVTDPNLEEATCLWTVLLPSAGSPPASFPDFLRYTAQMRLNLDGELKRFKLADWFPLRERLRGVLRASANADTPYLRILRKHLRE